MAILDVELEGISEIRLNRSEVFSMESDTTRLGKDSPEWIEDKDISSCGGGGIGLKDSIAEESLNACDNGVTGTMDPSAFE
mmetsp:Transcript_8700/g.18196  ORF Transcript_8700/g.18196 Transcript_8700/m.18196 type:complete len:81 (-) Transcript_8700:207-449(-)|eukprot:CAMPEP_0201130968 /NCGR_PEP_ID=MMETSP0850-20130426/41398_1 /ASSEMBLY_ACC=CAM_ASM_000622 /TAXON_ID=183588 /ORGANISM="Pseudo-nitzschia fraudulenta, Strain WWA7" /LENGTH=80 /DNA_ID=CAMNT_0047400885 /DNA_START=234 /DNA_END=476 /DNA_ORIENTATION=+